MDAKREKALNTQGINGHDAKGFSNLGRERVTGATGVTSYISRVGVDSGCLQWAGVLSLIPSRSLPSGSMIPS